VFYQWQLSGAKNLVLSQIQSETAYFQAGPLTSLEPFAGGQFSEDPDFELCNNVSPKSSIVDSCREGPALRIINSRDVVIHGAGLYSFFQNYEDTCAKYGRSCQDRLVETSYSEGIYIFSLYTVGASEVVSPEGEGYVLKGIRS
jgi:glucan 1,3-beta-glucosidase